MTLSSAPSGFTTTQTADIVGVTARQMDYWDRTDLLRPSLAAAAGCGSRRRYSYRDLLALKICQCLSSHGMRLDEIRQILWNLREIDITAVQVATCGRSPVRVDPNEDIIDLLQNGQIAVTVLSIADVKEQVDDAIAAMFTATEHVAC